MVFVDDPSRFAAFSPSTYSFDDIVNLTARQVAGIATITVVDQSAANAFSLALGDEHGVRDGAFVST